MNSENELFDYNPFPEEDQLTPKIEPINLDFIDEEKPEEKLFVVEGIIEPLKIVKRELCENEEFVNCSTNV